jgi:hypothetical protein
MSFESDRGRRLETLLARANRSRAVTLELLTEAIANACMRFHAHGHATKTAFNQLLDGEWHCFLSKQPQFPLEFDESAEGAHEVQPGQF